MVVIVAAFLAFMLLGRMSYGFLIINTLMLGACGIFDLFWWSILGELLDYSDSPAKIFGVGLSSNVMGVLIGSGLGMVFTFIQLLRAGLSVIALTVVCVFLVMLPSLNGQLVALLKSHTYLSSYEHLSQTEKVAVLSQTTPLDPLTAREEEVVQLLLSGMSNKEIAATLFISENTVKTHGRNIYSKYSVRGRAELINTLLRG
jgi:DNA-binding CsgD family transcriptional regulator